MDGSIKIYSRVYIMNTNELKIQTPSQERRRIENDKLEEQWQGCCSKTNKHYLKYIVQICMGSGIIIFSMVQVIRDVPNQEIYFSLISGTMGYFMPNPTISQAHEV